jgi:hypothetical protein
LDYNHEKIVWQPPPPRSMQTFYSGFLRWYAEVGIDDAIAEHQMGMFATVGLTGILETLLHEVHAGETQTSRAARVSVRMSLPAAGFRW